MHYHQRNTNDYARRAGHLTFIEHGALTLITDWIFSHRRPFPAEKEEIFRQIRPRNSAEKSTLLRVLPEFFKQTASGWITEAIAEEIAFYEEKSAKASKAALLRWENERNANAMRTHSEGNAGGDANGMPRARVPSTSNQEPSTISSAASPPESAALPLVLVQTDEVATLNQAQDSAKKKKGAARERNALFDALVLLTGTPLDQVTKALGGEVAAALRDIREVMPAVTPNEINRRGAAYRAKWPAITLSPSALAKHWGSLGAAPKKEAAGLSSSVPCPQGFSDAWEALYGGEPEPWPTLGVGQQEAILGWLQRQQEGGEA